MLLAEDLLYHTCLHTDILKLAVAWEAVDRMPHLDAAVGFQGFHRRIECRLLVRG